MNKEEPLVTVLMNGYNCEKYLKEAIESVYSQTYKNWEIVFIDNCSTDNTAKIANSFNNKLKYHTTPEHTNICQARIYAKEFITGDFLCILDTDDLWMPEKLEKQVKLMQENQDTGIIYTNTIYFTDTGSEKLAYDSMMPSGNLFKQLLENYFFSFETVMIRKSTMDELNIYFDPQYNVSSDAEFFTKLSYYTKCLYIDEPLGKWRYGHGSESDKSLCLFPKEYEILLSQLSEMIDNFEIKYKVSIDILKSKIDNMYGICHWNKYEKIIARKYFFKALKRNIKYVIPWLMSYCMDYKSYVSLRKKFKKI